MNKKEIIHILEEIGTMLELKGENPFKARAYINAARILETVEEDIVELVKTRRLGEIKGIGQALTDKLTTLVTTGHLPYYEELKASIPEGLFDLLRIPGMGPKKVKTVYDELHITTLGELEYACLENRLRDLPGFGQKSQEKILQGIELRKKYRERFHFHVAEEEAGRLLDYLKTNDKIIRMEIAGSLRRRKETIRDIDIVASCRPEDRHALMDFFVAYPGCDTVTGQGSTKSSIVLQSGMSADLRLVEDSAYPFALHHSSGSKEHNTAMRQRAKQLGFTMNEYGLFPQGREDSLACRDEAEIFEHLGLHFIPPELRENSGEIEWASREKLPELVSSEKVRGLFHVHSTYSDGANTIPELVERCRKMGLAYLGLADHSKSAFYANGLSEERVRQQFREIERLNDAWKDFVIFKGIEADILPDGRLDYDDDLLAEFDFVIASVHSAFRMSEEEMTARICRAIEHPLVTMIGHPTGRLLLGREAYPLNMERVLNCTARHGKIIEINANPHRLDMDWRWGKLARELGIRTAVNPDAHSLEGLEDFHYGIGIARKAWFESGRVVNTYPVEEIRRLFSDVRASGKS